MGSVAPCGAESEDIMLEVKSFVISSISYEATTEATTRSFDGDIGYKQFHLDVGVLPNKMLIGTLDTRKGNLFFKRVHFAISPNGDYQIIGYYPESSKYRRLCEHEIMIVEAIALQYNYPMEKNIRELIDTSQFIKF